MIRITNLNLPVLTTTAVSVIVSTYAISGGNISSIGGSNIKSYGVVWSTNINPTFNSSDKAFELTYGLVFSNLVFSSELKGLSSNTKYYIRAFAENSDGISYGNELSFNTSNLSKVNDIDGNKYQLVTICNQTWTRNNLNVSKYRNGDVIPQVTDQVEWAALTTGAWCYYGYGTPVGTVYGKLYNWYAVNYPRGLAPAGYHIPTDTEWTTLTTCLGGESNAGTEMKEYGNAHWQCNVSCLAGNNNSSDFTAFGGGYRSGISSYDARHFGDVFVGAHFWSSSVNGQSDPWVRIIKAESDIVAKQNSTKKTGNSVRCIKD